MNFEQVEDIQTKEEFADFVEAFRKELILAPDEWDNPDLDRFLGAMEAWVRAIDMYAKNSGDKGVVNPSWRTFAKILCAAKVYE
ncbi:hypothetical protein J4P02_11740 [Pseudomonas sp. NFXW11]|uniref:DUF7660 family protein n=1 Tax=Pseudomonas sp. NFXW11 TaxID=2819531 RepID=UPI003CF5228C